MALVFPAQHLESKVKLSHQNKMKIGGGSVHNTMRSRRPSYNGVRGKGSGEAFFVHVGQTVFRGRGGVSDESGKKNEEIIHVYEVYI